VDCIHDGKTPLTDGIAGLRVVELLEGAENFMRREEEGLRRWDREDHSISISA